MGNERGGRSDWIWTTTRWAQDTCAYDDTLTFMRLDDDIRNEKCCIRWKP